MISEMTRRAMLRARWVVPAVCLLLAAPAQAAGKPSSKAKKLGLTGEVVMKVKSTGNCVQKAGREKLGLEIRTYICGKSKRQNFQVRHMKGGWLAFRHKKSRLCIDVVGQSRDDGAPLVQSACGGEGARNQHWKIVAVGKKGAFLLKARHSGKCMALNTSDKKKTARMQQRTCNSKDANQILRVLR